MLNREEYNATFNLDLSAEEFARLKPIVLGGDNIKDIESITAVIPNTLERIEYVQVVRCKDCKYWEQSDEYGWCQLLTLDGETRPDWFCADGERIE